MKHPSPLRYPGGKTFLAKRFEKIFELNGLNKPVYVEPYAGGAGAALALLYADKVSRIVINDFDPHIHAFWIAAKDHTESFVRKIRSVPLDVNEWKRQREVYVEGDVSDKLKLGFASFYLNRTNRSGVMNAGPIGGLEQTGNYLIDARFYREALVDRIRMIGKHRDKITVRNIDGIALAEKYLDVKNSFIYLDPPYFEKGECLYLNAYEQDNHAALSKMLKRNREKRWMLTYDNAPEIHALYKGFTPDHLSLTYRIGPARKEKEVMYHSDGIKIQV